MTYLPENTSRRLTILYISSLSAIAALAILGQIRIQRLLNEQDLDIQVITAAQRQQLISQQLVKSTLVLRLPHGEDTAQDHTSHLQDVIQDAEFWQQRLVALQTATHLSSQQQQQVQTMVTDSSHQYEVLLEAAKATLAVAATETTGGGIQSRRQSLPDMTQLLRTEKAFINDMDRLILAYNQQVAFEANRLRHLEYRLLLVTITVLILEGCLVFHPATRKIRQMLTALNQSLQETKKTATQLAIEQQKSETLLRNILPPPIAQRLKQRPQAIADRFSDVTVLFADIVGFTQLSVQLSPEKVVSLLNSIFSAFDQLAEQHCLEKIKTIGDAYMAVGGLPEPRADHAEAVTLLALDMLKVIDTFNWETGHNLSIRVGINSGPVVAGVIGIKKFIYDLWGDTVNTASRMESHGTPGMIQITESTFQLIQKRFQIESVGPVAIKGKGRMMTYRVIDTVRP